MKFITILDNKRIKVYYTSLWLFTMNNDGILLITGSYDRTIRFWDAAKGATCRTIMHEDSVRINTIVFIL